MSKKQKGWIGAGVSVVVIIAIVLVVASIRSQGNSSAAAYQTTTVQVGTLTSSVDGSGTVASTQTANLSWQSSGQVDQVMAKIGSQVKSGDVLATLLQDSQTQTSLQTALVTAQENLAELTSPEAIANAKLAITTDQANVINAQIAVNNLQYWKNDALIQDYYANVVIAKANLDRAQTAYDDANVGDYINNPDEAGLYQALYNAQQAYKLAEFNFSVYSQKPTQRAVDAAQATLDLANATLAQDKDYLASLTGGNAPANATGTNLLKLQQAQLAVKNAQENLDATSLTAPFGGTITQANAVPGAVVSAGAQIFRIDNLSNLEVAVQVTEVDINAIQAGQPVTITFNAIPNKTYHGKVVQTNLAGTVGQNSTTFTVYVQLTDADALVKPGMAANVVILTNQVANALLVPTTAIFTDTNGQQYVYLIQNATPTTVPVTVGAVSDTTTQITGNSLKEGDTIILSFASTSTTSGGGLGFGLGGIVGGGNRGPDGPAVTPVVREAEMEDTVIQADGLTKYYRMGEVEVQALRGVSLQVKRGEAVAIMGPSGSGKTTLMNILGCLDRPTGGEYVLDGEKVAGLSDDQLAGVRNRKIGFVFQSFNLLQRTSALANVELPMSYSEQSNDGREKAVAALKAVGLESRMKHRPTELSGGEQQRVAIARALVNEPAILMADEPTGNLDTKVGQEIMNLLLALNRDRNMTLIIITHDPRIAGQTQRIIQIRDGLVEENIQ